LLGGFMKWLDWCVKCAVGAWSLFSFMFIIIALAWIIFHYRNGDFCVLDMKTLHQKLMVLSSKTVNCRKIWWSSKVTSPMSWKKIGLLLFIRYLLHLFCFGFSVNNEIIDMLSLWCPSFALEILSFYFWLMLIS